MVCLTQRCLDCHQEMLCQNSPILPLIQWSPKNSIEKGLTYQILIDYLIVLTKRKITEKMNRMAPIIIDPIHTGIFAQNSSQIKVISECNTFDFTTMHKCKIVKISHQKV